MKKKLLNLGCGANTHKDWINIDLSSKNSEVLRCNLKNGIPFINDSVDVIYHSHVLEHFSKKDAANFIKECHRVLKKGGILRISVPDLEQIARAYLNSLEDALAEKPLAKENYDWIVLEMLDQTTRNESGGEMAKFLQQPKLENEDFIYSRVGNEARGIREIYLKNNGLPSKSVSFKAYTKNLLRQILKLLLPEKLLQETKLGRFRNSGEIHQWMYDRYSLARILQEAGFHEIQQMTESESSIPDWLTYQLDTSASGKERKPDSLYMEAIRK